MYSTLLFLDRPRHLRYDMQAVLDLDQLLLEGFNSIFTMDADMDALRLIYWAGLKHEDPRLKVSGEGGTGDILQNAMVAGPWTYDNLTRMFTKTMVSDGWISPPQEVKERKTPDGEPFTLQDYISKMEELAYEHLHLTPWDFYGITPREFNIMMDVSGTNDAGRFGTVCATIANCSGAKKTGGGAFKADDFFHIKKKVVRESPETIKNKLRAAFGEAVG